MDDTNLRVEVDRATQARSLLEHPFYVETIQRMRGKVLKDFEAIRADEAEKMQRLLIRRDVIEAFVKVFEDAIRTGRLASDQLDHMEQQRPKQRRN